VKSVTVLLQTSLEPCLVETCAFHVIDKLSIIRRRCLVEKTKFAGG
jgi:hypothetical protein